MIMMIALNQVDGNTWNPRIVFFQKETSVQIDTQFKNYDVIRFTILAVLWEKNISTASQTRNIWIS